ncbi:Hypothetical_protein [Hexamita inflata]|uniref:Hypothetical_protein n=1 Tax=Hexamita inflata TaxID=28002 RepID=A0AA86UJB8_9EUKA|nr:Hypothetical protein HINF_LOCUS41057 [Hexamita inflata]
MFSDAGGRIRTKPYFMGKSFSKTESLKQTCSVSDVSQILGPFQLLGNNAGPGTGFGFKIDFAPRNEITASAGALDCRTRFSSCSGEEKAARTQPEQCVGRIFTSENHYAKDIYVVGTKIFSDCTNSNQYSATVICPHE